MVEPVYVVQSPKEVLLIYSGNREVRHVYMNVPHSANPKPSWYGESVGHYEGDTLVVDTIGLSPKAVIDNYHTPHTDALHVVERYHLIDGGRNCRRTCWWKTPAPSISPGRRCSTTQRRGTGR